MSVIYRDGDCSFQYIHQKDSSFVFDTVVSSKDAYIDSEVTINGVVYKPDRNSTTNKSQKDSGRSRSLGERRLSGSRLSSNETSAQGQRSRDASFDKQWESEFGDKGSTILPFLTDMDVLQHYSKEFKQAIKDIVVNCTFSKIRLVQMKEKELLQCAPPASSPSPVLLPRREFPVVPIVPTSISSAAVSRKASLEINHPIYIGTSESTNGSQRFLTKTMVIDTPSSRQSTSHVSNDLSSRQT